jgi:hypothetical protein
VSAGSIEQQDTGVIAEVPESERLDIDEGPGANALYGGADDDLEDVYADPGQVVDFSGEGAA